VPDHAQALDNLGTTLVDQQKTDEAIACYRRALELQPDYAIAHNNLGVAFKVQGKLEAAAACCRRALELNPDYAEAHNNLGNALKDQGNLDEAVPWFCRALELKPDFAEAHSNLGNTFKDQGRVDEAIACYRRALALKPGLVKAHNSLVATLHYRHGVTLAELAQAHAEFDRQYAQPLRTDGRPHTNPRDPDRRLRLGIVSPNFGHHPVGHFLIRALERLDRQAAEVTCYCDRTIDDDLTTRFRATAAAWRDVFGWTDEQLAEQIRADQVDILFDLAGHTSDNRLLVFARKPAPIQITWIGYEGTTGLSAMDCLLADRYIAPEGSELHYRERVLRMPDGYVCYDPPEQASPVGPLPALAQGHVTFGSFNNPAKITPEVVKVWAEILCRLPRARLVLKYWALGNASVVHRYRELFANRGVEPGRLTLLPPSSFADYLTAYGQIDIALDPFPFSGSATTCEALWMGLPVITCPGETFASRHGLTHLSNIGLTEMIARSPEDYVELAVRLAGDLAGLSRIRAGLRRQVAESPLCDGKRFAENLLSLLRDVWRDWCSTAR